MNITNLHRIFDNYIAKFDEINDNEHYENYKWEIVQYYIDNIKDKWDPNDEELNSRLMTFWKVTENLIDNHVCQPLYGLISHTKPEQDPEEVCSMMEDLFADDRGDLKLRQNKIENFISRESALNKEFSNGNWKYDVDQRVAMCLVFLNNPEHNYMYKATQAKDFADYVEYYNEWGTNSNFNLKNYYDMCNQIVDEIKKYPPLLELNSLRYERFAEKPLYEDAEYHLLAFDIIYCATTYNLTDGVEYSKLDSGERKVRREKIAKAQELFDEFNKVNEEADMVKTVQNYLSETFAVGTNVVHKEFGNGVIKEVNGTLATIEFGEMSKKLDVYISIANGLLTNGNSVTEAFVDENAYYVKNVKSINDALDRATATLMPYLDYLEM